MKNMNNVINMTAQRFGMLTVLERCGIDKSGRAKWKCLCDCGEMTVARGDDLKRSKKKSCGCLRATVNQALRETHGNARKFNPTTEYNIWIGIKQRCENPNCKAYPNYGGRGIKICDRWKNDFSLFLADIGEKPSSEYTVDRIDNDRNYCPENVHWATRKQQANNRRPARRRNTNE